MASKAESVDITTTESREEFVESRGGECENCGAGEELEIHHVNGSREDNSPENLMVLCSECHRGGVHGSKEGFEELREEQTHVTYPLEIDGGVWRDWKNTLPRSMNLNDALTGVVEQDTEDAQNGERTWLDDEDN